MYQRFGLVSVAACATGLSSWSLSASDAEHERDGEADQLIRQQEEHGRNRREDEHHRGGDAGFLARRPGDLVGLLAHFPQELERAQLCHDLTAVTCLIPT